MRYSDALLRHIADILVTTLSDKDLIRLRGEKKSMVEKIAAALRENFHQEERLGKDAERLAEEHLRSAPGLDRHRVVQLIKQRLAEERRFVL